LVASLKNFAFFKTIQFKLSALFCSITIALSILASVTFYDHKKNSLLDQVKENAEIHSETLAVNAATALLSSDKMQLSVLVFTEVKNPEVVSAAILDHEGRVLIHSDIKKIGKPLFPPHPDLPETNLLKEIKPILLNGKQIGSVMLTMDTSSVLEKVHTLKRGYQQLP